MLNNNPHFFLSESNFVVDESISVISEYQIYWRQSLICSTSDGPEDSSEEIEFAKMNFQFE